MYLGQQAGLHRVSHGDVTGQMLRAGFEVVEVLLIDSRFDDRRMNVFWPNVRGRTDRFISVFRKPA
jgi:predicted methyltransferase